MAVVGDDRQCELAGQSVARACRHDAERRLGTRQRRGNLVDRAVAAPRDDQSVAPSRGRLRELVSVSAALGERRPRPARRARRVAPWRVARRRSRPSERDAAGHWIDDDGDHARSRAGATGARASSVRRWSCRSPARRRKTPARRGSGPRSTSPALTRNTSPSPDTIAVRTVPSADTSSAMPINLSEGRGATGGGASMATTTCSRDACSGHTAGGRLEKRKRSRDV